MDHWHTCEECGMNCGPCRCNAPDQPVLCPACADLEIQKYTELGGEG